MRRVSLLVALALAAASLAPAQPLYESPNGVKLEGLEVPRYYLVSSFFSIAYSMLTTESGRLHFLQQLEIEPGSASEAALRLAIQQARVLSYGPLGPEVIVNEERNEVMEHGRGDQVPGLLATDTPEERRAKISAHRIDKARELGRIYRTLGLALLQDGLSITQVDQFIDQHVAPGTSMNVSDDPWGPESDLKVMRDVFEEESRLDGPSATAEEKNHE